MRVRPSWRVSVQLRPSRWSERWCKTGKNTGAEERYGGITWCISRHGLLVDTQFEQPLMEFSRTAINAVCSGFRKTLAIDAAGKHTDAQHACAPRGEHIPDGVTNRKAARS